MKVYLSGGPLDGERVNVRPHEHPIIRELPMDPGHFAIYKRTDRTTLEKLKAVPVFEFHVAVSGEELMEAMENAGKSAGRTIHRG